MAYIKVTIENNQISLETEGSFIETLGMVEWLRAAYSKKLCEIIKDAPEGKEE